MARDDDRYTLPKDLETRIGKDVRDKKRRRRGKSGSGKTEGSKVTKTRKGKDEQIDFEGDLGIGAKKADTKETVTPDTRKSRGQLTPEEMDESRTSTRKAYQASQWALGGRLLSKTVKGWGARQYARGEVELREAELDIEEALLEEAFTDRLGRLADTAAIQAGQIEADAAASGIAIQSGTIEAIQGRAADVTMDDIAALKAKVAAKMAGINLRRSNARMKAEMAEHDFRDSFFSDLADTALQAQQDRYEYKSGKFKRRERDE